MILLALAMAAAPPPAKPRQRSQPQKTRMSCDLGPVDRTFGESSWTVYACDDGSTLTISAAGNNPARPFYFVLRLVGGHYDVTGEGTGDKTASDAAAKDIRALDDDAVRDLLKTAQAVGKVR